MFYGVGRLEFLVPHSQSLKEKRSVLNRLKGRISSQFGIAVAEVDHQDLWQRGTIGVALVASGERSAQDALAAIRREAEKELRIEVIDFRIRVDRFDETDGQSRWEVIDP